MRVQPCALSPIHQSPPPAVLRGSQSLGRNSSGPACFDVEYAPNLVAQNMVFVIQHNHKTE